MVSTFAEQNHQSGRDCDEQNGRLSAGGSILSDAATDGVGCSRSPGLDQCPIARFSRKNVKHFDNGAVGITVGL